MVAATGPRAGGGAARALLLAVLAAALAAAAAASRGVGPLPRGAARGARAAPPSALRAKARAAKKSEPMDPDDYMRYLQSEVDRTELDTSPPADVDTSAADRRAGDGGGGGGAAAAADGSRRLSKARASAELIAEESSKGYLDESDEMRWYLVQCTPGFERSIERSFGAKVQYAGYSEDIAEARVPLRRTLVFQKRAGGYVPKDEPLMAGYVMVRMRMRRNLYNFVKDCESVLGFCGYDFGARNNAGGLKAGKGFVKPKPISEAEAARIWAQAAVQPKPPGDAPVIDPAADAAAAAAAAAAGGGGGGGGEGGEGGADAGAAGGASSAAADPAPPPRPLAVELHFDEGDRVRVLKGPFKNLEGPVLAMRAARGGGEGGEGEGRAEGAGDAEEGAKAGARRRAGVGADGAIEVDVELTLMGQPTRITVDARALASVLE